MFAFIYIIIITLVSSLLAAFAQYIFKRSVRKFKFNLKDLFATFTDKIVMLGFFVYIISLIIYLVALHLGELSYVYPFIASTFIFVTLISKYTLNERVTKVRVLGVFLIVAGIVLTALTY